jgi:hypothetical protein
MRDLEGFAIVRDRGEFRPRGPSSVMGAVRLMSRAVAEAESRSLPKLLIQLSGLSGLQAPTTYERYLLSVELAQESTNRMRLAVVARPELIDPQKIGVQMATALGVECDIFSSEDEALAWLDAPRT